MMVLDLQPFDVVEGVGLIIYSCYQSFPKSQLFRESRQIRESRNFRVAFPIPKKFHVPDPTRYFGFSHTSNDKGEKTTLGCDKPKPCCVVPNNARQDNKRARLHVYTHTAESNVT